MKKVFSCEFCEIFKNTSFTEHLRVVASELKNWRSVDGRKASFLDLN